MDELRWLLLIIGLLLIAGVYGWGRLQERRRRRTERREPVPGEAGGDPLLDDEPVAPESLRGALEELDHLIAEERASQRPGRSAPESAPRQRPAEPARPAAPSQSEEAAEPRHAAAPPPPEPPPASEPPPEPPRPAPEPAPVPDGGPPAAAAEPPPSEVGEERIIVLHVAAPGGYLYQGTDLVEALHGAGLRHGEHGIFHRVLDTRRGPVALFSAASMLEPGTFDLDRLDQMETPGVALFMQLPGPFDGLSAFDRMLEAARHLARQLDGQLLDGRRCELTRQTLEHIRDDLLEYRRLAHLAARRGRENL